MNSQSEIRNPKSEIDLIQERITYLRDNTDFVSALFDSLIGYAIIAADFDGNIMAYNEGARDIYGYTPEEIIGKVSMEIFFPKDFIEAGKLEDITRELIGKERFSYEGEKVKKDGSRFPAQVLLTLTKDKNSKGVGFIEIVQDLTESKRAKEAVLQSGGANLRKIIEKNADSIFIVDRNGALRYVNPATEAFFGRKAEELMGELFGFPVVAGETTEVNIIRRDGERRYAEMRVVEMDWQGESACLASLRDITGRKRAEEALRTSEEEAKRLAQENAVIAEIGRIISSTLNVEEVYERFAEWVHKIISFDRIIVSLNNYKDDTITIAYVGGIDVENRRTGDVIPLSGSMNEEIIRTRSSLLIQTRNNDEMTSRIPAILPSFQAGIRSMVATPLMSKDEVIGIFLLQSTKPNAYTEETLRLAERVGNQIAGAIANSQLFAERKRVEEALRVSEERYRTLFEGAAEGILVGDTESKQFKYANLAICRMLGYTAEELTQLGVADIHPKEALDHVVAEFEDQASGKKILASEIPCLRKDGSVIYASVSSTPIIIDGRKCNVGFFTDITEHKKAEESLKQAEEQLRQSQKMEAIGRLAGGIAHDFNNLLTVIQGNSKLSLLELKEDDPLRENIEIVQRVAERAAGLVRQLLTFSRRQVLQIEVLDLNTTLKNQEKILHRLLGEDIELLTLLAGDLGRVKTDPGQIEQVIMNFVINSKDAMPNGGKLTIETANVELDETYARNHAAVIPGHYVMLSVTDTGVGMAPEVKERIFEPFFTTKEKGKGTGLGLSTVYGIVKQSGGNIWVYSEPGHGTTFKMYFPRVDEPLEEVREKVVKEKLPRGSETILVVEDEEEVRKLAVRILRRQGYRVLQASHGKDALLVCKQHEGPIHLMLTDVVMPQMGGRELAEELKTLRPNVKVLFTSGYADTAIVHHGILEEGINFIQKPFIVEGLVRKVREVLDK